MSGGAMRIVTANLLLRDPHFKKGIAPNLKIGLLLAHGGQNVSFCAGVMKYLSENSWLQKFDYVIGCSGAACVGAYGLANQPQTAIEIITKDNCKNLIEKKRLRQAIDLNQLERTMRYSDRALKVSKVKSHPAEFHVAVTNMDGQGSFVNAKKEEDSLGRRQDVIDALIAGMAIPVTTECPRMFDGVFRVNSGLAMPLPVLEAVSHFGLTDLLVVLNEPRRPVDEGTLLGKLKETASASLFIHPHSRGLVTAFLNRKKVYNRSLAMANTGLVLSEGHKCRVAILSPERKISKICTDPMTLQNFADHGYSITGESFRTAG